MLQQMSEATLTLLLTMLALGAVIRFMPAAGHGRRGKKARSVAVWAGIGLGMVSSLALTIINVEAPKSVNRQTVGLFTLPVAIVLAVLFLALVGYVLAWVLVCFVTWVSYRLCSWNNRVWPAAFIMISLLANHALMIVRIIKAKRWIAIPKDAWNVMSWFINHEAVFTIAAGMALCAVVVLTWLASRSIPTVGANPAEGRLGRARSRLYKSMAGTAALGYLCGALLITVGVAYGSQEIELSPPESFSVVDDQVSVNLADISDGHLHRFEYTTSGGVKVRFIVIQKSGSSFGVGLDACDICGPTGYYEKDGKVICKLCEVAMNIATIGFKGGCNPIPIDYKVSNGTLTVPISALEASASVFAK